MAAELQIVRRKRQGKSSDRNQVHSVIINIDDGDSYDIKIQGCIDAMNAALGRTGTPPNQGEQALPVVYPSLNPPGLTPGQIRYFDEVFPVADFAITNHDNLRTDQDYIAFGPAVFDDLTQAI